MSNKKAKVQSGVATVWGIGGSSVFSGPCSISFGGQQFTGELTIATAVNAAAQRAKEFDWMTANGYKLNFLTDTYEPA